MTRDPRIDPYLRNVYSCPSPSRLCVTGLLMSPVFNAVLLSIAMGSGVDLFLLEQIHPRRHFLPSYYLSISRKTRGTEMSFRGLGE